MTYLSFDACSWDAGLGRVYRCADDLGWCPTRHGRAIWEVFLAPFVLVEGFGRGWGWGLYGLIERLVGLVSVNAVVSLYDLQH